MYISKVKDFISDGASKSEICVNKKLNILSSQQDEILQLIPNFFSSFLSDANPVIHQLAMEAFSRFAEVNK